MGRMGDTSVKEIQIHYSGFIYLMGQLNRHSKNNRKVKKNNFVIHVIQ